MLKIFILTQKGPLVIPKGAKNGDMNQRLEGKLESCCFYVVQYVSIHYNYFLGEEFSVLKSFFSAISEKKQEFTFNLANALYLQEGFTVKEQYLHSNKEFFQSAIKLVDFQDAKTSAETISTWVESKTHGKVSHFHKLIICHCIHGF